MIITNIVNILSNGAMQLNGSKYFAGVMMLLMNLGGRYISMELTEMHEKILNHKMVRRLLVFVLVFYATRDIKVSLVLTAVFIVIVSGIFNEDSKYCLIPNSLIIDKRRKIKKNEYLVAQEIVNKYQKQQKK